MTAEPQRDVVRRAVDVVAEQLKCDPAGALRAIQDVAAAADQEPIEYVAAAVLDGRVRFGS
jgi:hypothetical protein